MFSFLFPKKPTTNVPQQLYGEVVAQGRLPAFFVNYGFKDEVMGRFDVLSLHLFLLSHRLGAEGEPKAVSLAQEVFDCFTEGVDDALRVLGIGDTSVPKKKKKMVRSFYGQIEDFRNALLEKDEDALTQKVKERFFADTDSGFALLLARYMLETDAHLAAQPLAGFYKGELSWIDPVSVLNTKT